MAVLVYFFSYSGVTCFPFLVQVDPESVSEAEPQEVVEVVQTPGGGERVAEQSARPAVLAIKSPLKDRMRSASACGFNTSTPVSLVVCVFFWWRGLVLILFLCRLWLQGSVLCPIRCGTCRGNLR